MTREKFIADHRHALMGVFVEGLVTGQDKKYDLFLRLMYSKIDAALGAAFDALDPPKPVAQNGVPRRDGNVKT